MAAAVTLADAGVAVKVYEAAPDLGGRARRVVVNGVVLDNGLHILIGAHRETLRLISRVHPTPHAALTRSALDWNIHCRFRLKAAPLPAPLHLACGVLAARGATWSRTRGGDPIRSDDAARGTSACRKTCRSRPCSLRTLRVARSRAFLAAPVPRRAQHTARNRVRADFSECSA